MVLNSTRVSRSTLTLAALAAGVLGLSSNAQVAPQCFYELVNNVCSPSCTTEQDCSLYSWYPDNQQCPEADNGSVDSCGVPHSYEVDVYACIYGTCFAGQCAGGSGCTWVDTTWILLYDELEPCNGGGG